MKHIKIRILIVLVALTGVIVVGIKPTQNEFMCPDSTARCYEEWTINNEFYINKKPLHISMYGYEWYGHPIFWVVFISKRNSDLILPIETRVSWFNKIFEKSELIPNMVIKKIGNDYFSDRYELVLDERQSIRIVMGRRSRYFNPFPMKNGKFVEGIR